MALEFPLVPEKPPEQVGVSYYYANFKDGIDFLSAFRLPVLMSSAGLKKRVEYYWERFKLDLRRPKRGEAWCEEALSFQAAGDLTNRAEIESRQ